MPDYKSGDPGPSLGSATNSPRDFGFSGPQHQFSSSDCKLPILFSATVYVGGWGYDSNLIII